MNWIVKYMKSSIGRKQVMGATGAIIALWILGHMVGNLQLFFPNPAEAYNAYSYHLTSFKPFLYSMEAVMTLILVVHIYLAVTLKIENKAARPVGYDVDAKKGKKSFATFTMIISGLIIAAFLIMHLYTLKFGTHYVTFLDGKEVRDMYRTTIEEFSKPWYAGLYVAAMFCIGMHLWHAVSSAFQTFGLNHSKWNPIINALGAGYTILVAGGFAVQALYAHFILKGTL